MLHAPHRLGHCGCGRADLSHPRGYPTCSKISALPCPCRPEATLTGYIDALNTSPPPPGEKSRKSDANVRQERAVSVLLVQWAARSPVTRRRARDVSLPRGRRRLSGLLSCPPTRHCQMLDAGNGCSIEQQRPAGAPVPPAALPESTALPLGASGRGVSEGRHRITL